MGTNGQNMDKNGQNWSKLALNGLKLYFFEKKFFDKNGQNRTKIGQKWKNGKFRLNMRKMSK